jgi:hypothetical protein
MRHTLSFALVLFQEESNREENMFAITKAAD